MAYGPRELVGITREAFAAHSARDPGYVVRVAESLAAIGVEDRRTLRKRLAALGAMDAQIGEALERMRPASPIAHVDEADRLFVLALAARGATLEQIDRIVGTLPATKDRDTTVRLRAFACAVWSGDLRRLLDDDQFGRMAHATRLVALMAWFAWETLLPLSQAQRIEAIGAALDGDARLPELSIDVIEKAVKRYTA